MCFQQWAKCRCYKCPNMSQKLDLTACSKKPNCEIEFVQVPLKKSTVKPYCEECKRFAAMTQKERSIARAREQYARKLERERSELVRKYHKNKWGQMQSLQDAHGFQIEANEQQERGGSSHSTLPETAQEEITTPATPSPEFESTESEDEAYEVALILLSMSRGEEQAPPSSRSGP